MNHQSVNSPLNIYDEEEEAMLVKKQEYEEEESKILLPQLMKLKRSQWWVLVLISIFFLISAQAIAVLLGRFYYNQGGNSKWISTLVQTIGFPILCLPLSLLPSSSSSPPSSCSLAWIYVSLGLAIALDNLLYSYGLLFLSASTYSLVCASQLIFNALFSYYINSQKLTSLILISVILLTISASVISLDDDDSDDPSESNSKLYYIIGFFCTLAASLVYSLQLSLMQYSFEKVIKKDTFGMVLEMQIYTSLVASFAAVVGLLASGEWKSLRSEMEEFQKGKIVYVLTLVGTSVSWQLGSVGAVALIFLVSSLFSNLVGTLSLVVTPLAALFVFHEKFTEGKMIAMVTAIPALGFYMYQNYLDDLEVQRARETQDD
ncbi:unnamed protein product [Cochlearia groenlandica]